MKEKLVARSIPETAFITGAGTCKTTDDGELLTTVGSGIALELAKQGCEQIILHTSKRDKASEIVSRIEEAGAQVEVLEGNFTKPEEMAKLARQASQVAKRNGRRIEVLVNTVGLSDVMTPETTSIEWEQRMFNINCHSPLALIRTLGPKLAKGGTIFDIGTNHELHVSVDHAVYRASKLAFHGGALSYAKWLMDSMDIATVFVGLGWTWGPRHYDNPEVEYEKVKRGQPTKRWTHPEDVGRFVLDVSGSEYRYSMHNARVSFDNGVHVEFPNPVETAKIK